MLEEEPVSFRDKFFRFMMGIFLFILVGGLVMTLLPGDANRGMMQLLTGGFGMDVGKIGEIPLSVQYYQRARKTCAYRYKQYISGMKKEQINTMLDNCAFSDSKRLKVAQVIGEKIGYDVSQYQIKKELSDEARMIHKQSDVSAGYEESEVRSANEIYQMLLKEENLEYRKDSRLIAGLFGNFLVSKLPTIESVETLKKESETVKLSLNYISFSDDEIMKSKNISMDISDAMLKEEYQKENKEGKTPKNKDGKFTSFEKRKSILRSKVESRLRAKKISELKSKIATMKKDSQPLTKIAEFTGSKIETIKDISLSDINAKDGNQASFAFLSDSKFLQDMAKYKPGQPTIGGPYKDIEKNIYVEFAELNITSPKPTKNDEKSKISLNQSQNHLMSFLRELNESIGNRYPILKNTSKQAN